MDNTTSSANANVPPKANATTATISVFLYVYMFIVFMCWFGWTLPRDHLPSVIANILPFSIDTAETNPNSIQAAIIDVMLLMSFVVPHSVLARSSIKEMMGLPKALERSFYVLQTTVFMHTYMYCWQDFAPEFTLWKLPAKSLASSLVLVVFLAGMVFLLSATFALDHFALFGLSQGFGVDLNRMFGLSPKDPSGDLVVRWHYSIVAHPIMTGLFVCLWATPVMAASRFLFALVNTVYILVAVIKFEEPSLTKMIGTKYLDYRRSIPRFIPGSGLGIKVKVSANKTV